MSADNSDAKNHHKQLVGATDTDLVTNKVFQQKQTTEPEFFKDWQCKEPCSQRDLLYEDANSNINVSETIQGNIANKFHEIISKQVEFFYVPQVDDGVQIKKIKSRLKLLKDADCYVSPYKKVKLVDKGPQRKPEFKRRTIDKEDVLQSEMDRIESAAISVESILNGDEVKYWTKKPERPDKVFYYKMNNKNVANLQEPVNEFTKLRNKNQWHESKIKNKHICK